MMKIKFLWCLCLLILILWTACDSENGIADSAILSDVAFTAELSLAEPLIINPDLAGLVSMEVGEVIYEGSGIWTLALVFENNSEYMLICGSMTDRLEFFDGEYWRSVPRITGMLLYANTIFPRGGFAIIFNMDERDEFGNMAYVKSGIWPEDYDEKMAGAVPWDLGFGYVFERNGTNYLFSPRARPENVYETWQFTLRLNPRFFGLEGPMGDALTEFPPGKFRLRHRLWPDTFWRADSPRISDVAHEVVAEFQLR